MKLRPPIKPALDPLNRAFYLPRLPRAYYQGDAVVHWTLTVFDKAQGWLTPALHQRFRELMLHAARALMNLRKALEPRPPAPWFSRQFARGAECRRSRN